MQHKKNTRKSSKKNTTPIEGIISLTRSGIGFFAHKDFEDDIRIEHEFLNTALHGDTVEVLMLPKMPGEPRRFGKVLRVIERAQTQFVGTLSKETGNWTLQPDNNRFYKPILIEQPSNDLKVEHKALVEMIRWDNPDSAPRGEVREVLGKAGEHETEMKAILLEKGFTTGFPKEVEDEAQALANDRDVTDEELTWRKDFRDVPTFTIDPHDAKDFDDALSVRKLDNLPAPRPGEYFVYAILCSNDSIYIGQTSDLQKRYEEHKAGTGGTHTKKFPPKEVIHYEVFNSREEALKRESDLKTGFGRKWLRREWKAGRTRQAGGNYEIGIHIADVTHYVRPGTALEKEARKRATSVYLVDRTIPMLPEVLSNGLCSLKPNEERRAFAAVFEVDANADVKAKWFGKTLINSDKRFTYQEAQDVLDGEAQSPHDPELNTLWTLSEKLRQKRIAAGAIEFDTDEIQFELDENGAPVKAYVKERLNTMKMIEEWMLLANRYVAAHISEHAKGKNPASSVAIYRIHDMPDPDKLEELNVFLRALGHDHFNKDPNQIEAKDIARLMRDVQGTPEQAVVQTATLRSMAKAVYSDKNIGHFSLGFQHYTHFTSPIRRYPDMMVHRILFAHLKDQQIPEKELIDYRQLAIASSQREVDAVQAERDSVKFKQVEYMAGRVGTTFTGTVSGVTKGGMFVAEDVTKAEGMIRAADIPGDWYELNEKQYALIGRKSDTAYRIGDPIKMRLKRADVEARELDWEIVD